MGLNTVIVRRANVETPLILSGLPAYQSAAFYLPIEANPVAGYLQVDATLQSLSGVEGVLRVSIDNVKRAELLLAPGEMRRSFQVQLTPEDIAQERLNVSFSLQGTGPHGPCDTAEGIETSVEIEPSSALYLTLDRPMTTPYDAVLVQGRSLNIAWDYQGQAARILAARDAQLAGLAPSFDETGLSPEQTSEIARHFSQNKAQPRFAWSRSLAPWSPIYDARGFSQSQSWRIKYDMMQGQDMRLPERLELSMMLDRQTGAGPWQVYVLLNGMLVDQIETAGGALTRSVTLPAQQHQRENVLELIATSMNDTTHSCTQQREVFAQVDTATDLIPGPHVYSDGLITVRAALANGWAFSTTHLSASEASIAADLLTNLPRHSQMPSADIHVQALARGARLHDDYNGHIWLIFMNDQGVPVAVPLQDYQAIQTHSVALLVRLGQAAS